MALTLYALIQTAVLCTNALAVLHEERFLSKLGWGVEQGVGGFGDDPGVKAQILNLIRSVRTVMRGENFLSIARYRSDIISAQIIHTLIWGVPI
uniref:Immediate early response 3-interacting protein 1 n=1 Tax=Gouania willdenowi TaxID=441366 RepID=A0A8C5N930_GOUWI